MADRWFSKSLFVFLFFLEKTKTNTHLIFSLPGSVYQNSGRTSFYLSIFNLLEITEKFSISEKRWKFSHLTFYLKIVQKWGEWIIKTTKTITNRIFFTITPLIFWVKNFKWNQKNVWIESRSLSFCFWTWKGLEQEGHRVLDELMFVKDLTRSILSIQKTLIMKIR